MRITPLSLPLEELIGKSTGVRAPGLHISDIYNRYFQVLEPKRYGQNTPFDTKRVQMGLTFESIVEEGLRAPTANALGQLEECARPGEMTTSEGIAFNPDLIIFGEQTRIGEIKLTWLSCKDMPREESNALPPKFQKYVVQMQAYCHACETPYARLIAYFVNGDYKPMAPQLKAWDFEFTKRELYDNWQLLLNVAKGEGML